MNEEFDGTTTLVDVDDDGFAVLTNTYNLQEEVEQVLKLAQDVTPIVENVLERTEDVLEVEDHNSAEQIYVNSPLTDLEERNNRLREISKKARESLNKNKLKLDERSQQHFNKHFQKYNGECQNFLTRSNHSVRQAKSSDTSVVLVDKELHLKQQESIENIAKISKLLLKQVEDGNIVIATPVVVKKSFKEKLLEKVSDTKTKIDNVKRDIFFSVVKRAQKALKIK